MLATECILNGTSTLQELLRCALDDRALHSYLLYSSLSSNHIALSTAKLHANPVPNIQEKYHIPPP
ncbi:protein of unknown function [Legionella fallonii LLAP-10]|uniref:Uncharacterized protein n=1 Tax=Legionella fallonii LLAP-10 TaxID=1212491 RepID=A0A098G3P3_9GAMM|nr:protein of unknown function [Legionella fallonii LLAP-10]